jgi:hypothetical protein
MTSFIEPITARYSSITSDPKNIDWIQTGRNLLTYAYRVALVLAVACYLTFLALRGVYRLGITARSLWIKYEVSAKIAAAVAALKTEFDNVQPVSVRVAEVRSFATVAQSKIADFTESTKSEVLAITGK